MFKKLGNLVEMLRNALINRLRSKRYLRNEIVEQQEVIEKYKSTIKTYSETHKLQEENYQALEKLRDHYKELAEEYEKMLNIQDKNEGVNNLH